MTAASLSVTPAAALSVTPAAARHVLERLRREKGRGLRVGVRGSGCSGYRYHLEAAQAPREGDEVFQSNGVTLIVDRESLLMLVGTEIDYVREGLNASLKFNNPNVTATCGCGQSFAVEQAPAADVAEEQGDGAAG